MPGAGIKTLKVQIPPFTVVVDNCLVHILEVLEHRLPWGEEYTVSMRVDCGNIRTRVFNLTVKNTQELKAKILAEITKLRLMRYIYGDKYTQEIVGGVSIV